MKILPILLRMFLCLTLIIALQACNSSNNQADNISDNTPLIPVEVSIVNRGDISAYYSNTATLEAEQEATVVSKVSGIIQELYVEEGDRIQAGQVIARIEDDQYRIEANRAKATLDRLQNELQRNRELFERNLIAAELFQNAQFEYESQKATYELAMLNLENREVRSPISGVVSERYVKKGNMIGTEQQLYRVTDFTPLSAILHVPEHEMSKIRKNQRAELRADALPNKLFVGYVDL